MSDEVIEGAIREARRRQSASDRDLGPEVEHYAQALRFVSADWGLEAEVWLPGGVNPPPIAVRTEDGSLAVLKIQSPGVQDAAVAVLQAAAGISYARVLRWDASCGALLTEKLGESLWEDRSDLVGQARVIAPLLRQAWTVPLEVGSVGESKASGLARILATLGPRYGAAAPRALALATTHAEFLAAGERAEVVCHGDPHAGNVLRRGDGWALIDPDGFVGERAYDLGIVLRDACAEFLEAEAIRPGGGVEFLWQGSRLLAEFGGASPDRVWRWGFVERVTTGLYLHWFGHSEQGAQFLGIAETIARADTGAALSPSVEK
ncbi:aminoglycoside phosphotransferase family protein [Tessaracoccus caeni]|uniref:aminoglycoside phosphotransferase family protein n=1 Tax=Tessaracoccus caeni TaxID=3031239 RepID=UPI0023DCB208|nr:aminoglycoside phosphotransferase family protein [Tessaracoccus caeni]MDF1490396.1 aminoglycoside phosphotransferase family protein [Tessaracoccus caeni]